jgi:23S rRNA (pseudouridine1915-N3)-methyltransferase
VRILLVTVGKVRAPFVDDVAHYTKHLAMRAQVEQVEVRDAAAAIRRIPDRSTVVLLDSRGTELDSLRFADFISERQLEGRPLCFVIGGADGIDIPDCDHRISFGPITLPHQLARVVLLEQLFRAHSILAGEPYHR